MRNYLLFLVVVILACVTIGYADYYTWEDESGASHISDQPPPKTLKTKNLKVYEQAQEDKQEAADGGKKMPDITLYTKNDCPDCDKAREFLTSQKLSFTEHNLDTDETAKEKRKAIDGLEDVPFAVIGRNQVYGFSETIYSRALKMAP